MPSEKKVNTINCNKCIQFLHKWHPCLPEESHIFLVPFHQCTWRTLWRGLRRNSRKLWRPATETQLSSNFQAPRSRIESDIDYHKNVAHAICPWPLRKRIQYRIWMALQDEYSNYRCMVLMWTCWIYESHIESTTERNREMSSEVELPADGLKVVYGLLPWKFCRKIMSSWPREKCMPCRICSFAKFLWGCDSL